MKIYTKYKAHPKGKWIGYNQDYCIHDNGKVYKRKMWYSEGGNFDGEPWQRVSHFTTQESLIKRGYEYVENGLVRSNACENVAMAVFK